MLSGDSGQGESICTPRSVSKRLFGVTGGSSSKRSLFGQADAVKSKDSQATSGEESDLGPMSPLALTDMSDTSRESSPGRSFVSPLTTPEQSPRNHSLKTWDRLRPYTASAKSENRVACFDALKTLTRAARSSPKRKIILNSPKSLPSTPTRLCDTERPSWMMIGTPEREMALLFNEAIDEIVPETPNKETTNDENYGDEDDDERIEETPQKADSRLEQRLVTPLSSCVLNEISIPRLNRRKSLCLLDDEETWSPDRRENTLKRRATNDCDQSNNAKIQKIDDNYTSVPKARASLFPEAKRQHSDQTVGKAETSNFVVSTKSFYKSSLEKRGRSLGNVESSAGTTRIRHSLPSSMSNHTYHRRTVKRPILRRGMMNAGVRHGIKRPKPKRHVSRIEAFATTKKQDTSQNSALPTDDKKIEDCAIVTKNCVASVARPLPPSPVADPNKRFFKTNRTLKTDRLATVTVNDRIKLNVSDGKIALNDKHSQITRSVPRKRARLEDMSFDATDLTVDEPNFDTSTDKSRMVDGILKVLEDDWADDEYDTMDTLTILSPIRTIVPGDTMKQHQNATMSPASVLSNMTLSMNIKDSSVGTKMLEDNNCQMKLYPLFEKGFSSGIVDENTFTDKKKSDRGVKRSWQTSAKGGGAEDQYQIDAGQKKFGATSCSECGIVYQLGVPEDENAHLVYHNNVKTLRFNGWKNERVIMEDPLTNSRIISIEPGDPKQCWKKVELVLAVVDKDLGLAEMEVSSYLDKKIYFYVRDKTILGVMVAESIKVAHRMIPELIELNCCSAEDTPAKCGINVIWTAMSHRRKHIATKLLDSLRTTYYFGYIMSLEDIAFSMPTPSGKIFAEKYTKTRNFKVYS